MRFFPSWMPIVRTPFVAALVLTVALSAGSAKADYPDYVKSACRTDFKRFCPKYDVDSKELRACMRAVATDLTTRCSDALERYGERKGR